MTASPKILLPINYLWHHQTGATVDNTRPQRKRTTKEYLEKRSEKEMWTAGYKYSWRKMEAAARKS